VSRRAKTFPVLDREARLDFAFRLGALCSQYPTKDAMAACMLATASLWGRDPEPETEEEVVDLFRRFLREERDAQAEDRSRS
jgi:hypothetical protein